MTQDLYPSRYADTPAIRPRRDPVVRGTGPAPEPLNDALVRSYEENGFLVLDSVLDGEEVAALCAELKRLRADEATLALPQAIKEPESNALRSLFQVHRLSPVFARLCRDERFAGMARYILDDDVYIHQSRLNYKPGFTGKEFYWHSDFETWHAEDGMPRMRALSISITLTDNSEFNGPLMLIPGSHKTYVECLGETPKNHYEASLRRQEYGVPDPDSLAKLVAEGGIGSAKGAAGSVVMFDCNTMHGSNSNITPLPRSNLFFVYNAVSNRVVTPYCGRPPRPEFVASRNEIEVIEPLARAA